MGPWLSTGTRCLTGRLVLGLSPGGLPLNTGKYDLLKAEWQGESMKSGYSTQRTEVSLAPRGGWGEEGWGWRQGTGSETQEPQKR